jgi:serine protease
MRNIYPEIAQYLGGSTPPPPPPPPPPPADVTELANGVSVAIAAQQGNERMFVFDVPATATSVSFQMAGGSGDADMYIKYGAQPTRATGGWDHRPYINGNNELVTTTASAGKWYVMVHAWSTYSGATLVARYTTGGGNSGDVLVSGVPVANLSGAQGSEVTYRIVAPVGVTNLRFQISGGTGDADLYVRKGTAPTRTVYDYRPYIDGNNELVTATPSAGTWYVMLRGYTAYSGVTLVATAE